MDSGRNARVLQFFWGTMKKERGSRFKTKGERKPKGYGYRMSGISQNHGLVMNRV
jgi:hypothetical protein